MAVQSRYLLALDQGTTSCRALLFDQTGAIISKTQRPFTQYYPKPGWVEQDPEEILSVQISVMQDTVAKASIDSREIAAVGLTNQRETLVVWDRHTGRPVYPAIVWQCRRTAAMCGRLKAAGLETEIRERTGLVIDAYFTATKLMWLLSEVPGLRARAERGELLAGTIDSWLIWHLSGRQKHVTDVSNASRTLLMNLGTGDWDEVLLREFNIPRCLLPEIVPSSGFIAALDPVILPGGLPIAGLAGDQQAALFGQACYQPGMTKNTYGTGCFLLMYTGRQPVRSQNGLLTTVAWDLGHGLEYALEGSVFNAGSAIQWLRDGLGMISRSAECDALAATVENNGGVYFVPAFTGLGAPYWDMQARGMLVGLTRGSGKEQIARAVLESIAHQSLDVLSCMQDDAGCRIPVLRADGGASVSDFLMQFQADISGLQVERPVVTETTAFGAACLAGLAVGVWPDCSEMTAIRQVNRVFYPQMSEPDRLANRQAWHHAVQTAMAYGRTEQTPC
ncbi:MAG: glycerol kinase GlpK [Clostridiaceae bacterium]|nr:glycerol kinase GlpK [Clostridiaceae bacterium]